MYKIARDKYSLAIFICNEKVGAYLNILINYDIVYVKGAINGAIYNLRLGDVFSINSDSCNVIDKFLKKEELNDLEQEYISLLIEKNLLNPIFKFREYVPLREKKLKMCWLEITQQCNCRCIHCYEGENHFKTDNPLSLNEWLNIIDQISDLGVKNVVVIGGEPCVHQDICEIIEKLAKKKINTTLFSNGTCISSKLKDIMIKNNIHFKCSVYGHNSKIHDTITNHKGSFEKLMNNINFFKDNGVDVTVAVVIMKENENYYSEISEFVNSLGVKFRFDVIREVFNGNQSEHVPSNDTVINSAMKLSPKFAKIYNKQFDMAMTHNTCWYGKLAICEDGNVLPCVFERNISYGNVRVNTIENILDFSVLDDCWDLTIDNIDECKDCEYRYACKDCRPLAMACKTVYSKNPRCKYNVYRGEWIGKKSL